MASQRDGVEGLRVVYMSILLSRKGTALSSNEDKREWRRKLRCAGGEGSKREEGKSARCTTHIPLFRN
jgi:hypothetical protein